MTRYCYNCHQELAFDDDHISKNGIKIPLDPDTHAPHDCPNDPWKQKNHVRPKASLKQPQQQPQTVQRESSYEPPEEEILPEDEDTEDKDVLPDKSLPPTSTGREARARIVIFSDIDRDLVANDVNLLQDLVYSVGGYCRWQYHPVVQGDDIYHNVAVHAEVPTADMANQVEQAFTTDKKRDSTQVTLDKFKQTRAKQVSE